MRKKKKKSLLSRIARGVLLLIVAVLAYSIVGSYAPFIRCPEIDDVEAYAAVAAKMLAGIDSADRAAILETRTDALNARIRLMSRAKEEIVITTYDCRDGESTRDILCVALHKADEGVKVRMLVDGVAGRIQLMPSDLFQALAMHPNVEIRFYNLLTQYRPWRHMGRMHDKYVIVDDLGYILGGRNMFDSFLGEYPAPTHSHDREALVFNGGQGSAGSPESSLFQLRAYFDGMWALADTTVFAGTRITEARRDAVYEALSARYASIRSAQPDLFGPFDYAAATDPTRGIWLVTNPTTIYAKQPAVFTQMCALMRQAQDQIIIHSPYAVLNDGMRDALADIAAQTPTTLMINAVENGDNVVASSDYLYHKPEVLSTGVRLLEYAGGDSYHGKSIAIDDNIAVIGSYNLDLRSTYVDTELMLVIHSEEVNARLRENMEALHADCRRVIDADSAEVPEGLSIPPLPLWKRITLRVLGGAMQLVRNLV